MTKQTYVVAEGISAVNGKPVPNTREIGLTEREALYDLSLGRIAPKVNVPTRRKSAPARDGLADLTGEA